MAWSMLSRQRARERFWAPVDEQAGAILAHHDAYQAIMELSSGDGSMIDGSIFGRRWNSPVFRRALLKRLRESCMIPYAAIA